MSQTHQDRETAMVSAALSPFLLLGLLLGLLCASCGGPSGTLRGTTLAEVVEAPAPGASVYTTVSSDGAVLGDEAGGVARGIARAAQQNHTTLEGDGRLALLAAWTAEHLGEGGTPPPHDLMEFFSHHLGVVEPTPHLIILGQPDAATLEDGIADSVSQRLSRQPYTHYGAAVIPRQGLTLAVITLATRWLELDPIPRGIEAGAVARLHGRLASGYQNPVFAITTPDGSVIRERGGEGQAFDLAIPSNERGVLKIEILADGPHGDTVVANFPLYVGVDAPHSVSLSSGGEEGGDPNDVATALLALLNDARLSVGAPLVIRDDRLDGVAHAHSEDMVEHEFVGHTSPTTGGAPDRLRRAGFESGLMLENIGRGYGAEEIHRGLMESPGHRANVLNSDVSHVGIGVVAEEENGRTAYIATEVFIRMNSEVNLDVAPRALLAAINDARQRRGAPPLEIDPNLETAAQHGAEQFFSDSSLSQQDVVDDASASLRRFAIAFSRVGGLMAVVDRIDEAGRLEPTFDPDIRFIGIGVAQGTRRDAPPNSIAVVMMLAWPR